MNKARGTVLVTIVIMLLWAAFIPMYAWADPLDDDILVPTDVSVHGTITDNFANIT